MIQAIIGIGVTPPPEEQVAKTVFLVGDDLIRTQDFMLTELNIPVDPNNREQDRKQLLFILHDILQYPSSQLASLHRDCDRIGNYDIDVEYQQQNGTFDHNQHQICSCCGFRKQESTASTCISSEYIKLVGLPTLLYFSVIKHVSVLLLLSLVFYSGYAFISNITSSPNLCESGINCYVMSISLSSKRLSSETAYEFEYMIQSWLGVLNVFILGAYFFWMTYRLRKLEIECELEKSVSDFSIMIEYLPSNIGQERLQEILNEYYEEKFKDVPSDKKRPFEIVTFNVAEPFYMNSKTLKDKVLKSYQELYEDKLDMFRDWIKERINNREEQFRVPKEKRNQIYIEFNQIKDNVVQKTHQLLVNVSQQFKKKFNQKQTQTVFVTFRYQLAAYSILQKNQNHYSSKIRDFLKSITVNERLSHPDLEGAIISKAPEPEDIIWCNVGVPECLIYWKKCITFTVTAIILCISFGIMYGLSIVQELNHEDQIISFLISIVILITNSILEYFIRLLTIYQKNFTKTNYETSFGIKVVIAQSINAVVFTFICNYIIRIAGLYETGGLTEDVFYLAISGGLVTPILRLINPEYWIKKILLYWKERPAQKLKTNQGDLNDDYEGTKFDLASGYVYLLKLYIFTSFYISLQPIIPVIGLVGLLLMYWGQKHNLLQKSVRPPPGSDILNNYMNQILYFSPVFFSLGTLTWAVFIPNGRPKSAIIPGLISLGLAVIFFILPLDTIFTCAVKQESLDHIYEEERVYFTTEYDRRNPATSQQGMKNYMEYLRNIRIKAEKNINDEESKRLMLDIDNLQAKEELMNKGSSKRYKGRRGGYRNTQFQDPNNPLSLAQAQTDLAQKDTTTFIQNALSFYIKNTLLNGLSLFPSNNNMQSGEDLDDKKSVASHISRKSNYPEKVFDPLSYFQQAVELADLSPDRASRERSSLLKKEDEVLNGGNFNDESHINLNQGRRKNEEG